MSLTTLPPISRSPLVCCSRPQMMRRNVVLPQPEGPSSTMNSPSGTLSEMPSTAGTSANFLTMFLVYTAAIEPPGISVRAWRSGFAVPLREDRLGLLMGPFDRVLGGHLTGRGLRHHVADDEVVVDLVHGRPGRTGISR